MACYRLTFYSLSEPHTLEAVSTTVATLLERRHADVYAMLTMPGLILIGGLSRMEAEAIQEKLLQYGCMCLLEEERASSSPTLKTDSNERDASLYSSLAIVALLALLVWFLS